MNSILEENQMFKKFDYNLPSEDDDTKSLSFKDIGEFNLICSSQSVVTEELRSVFTSSTEMTTSTASTSSSLQTVYIKPNGYLNQDTISTQTPVSFLDLPRCFDSISSSFSSATTVVYLNSSSQTDQSTLVSFNDCCSTIDDNAISACSSYCSIITIQNSAI